jgi:hypothetical protein
LLLLALQTTTSAAGDSRIDTLALVLVVIFIAAMLTLSLLLRRPESDDPGEPALEHRQADVFAGPHMPDVPPVRRDRPAGSLHAFVPVWLQGVAIPMADASLSDATRVIEALLAARRSHDLAAGLALYAPGPRAGLRERLGIGGFGSTDITFTGEPPALRSAEIVEGAGARMTVRATYFNGASENYTLTWLDGTWFVEEITASR